MATPQEEAALIMAAAIDRQTDKMQEMIEALASNTRASIIGGLYGQLVSNVAFRHSVRVPRINDHEKAEVATLANAIEEM